MASDRQIDLVIDAVDELRSYKSSLEERGYQGETEADDAADYVGNLIDDLVVAFELDYDTGDDEEEDEL